MTLDDSKWLKMKKSLKIFHDDSKELKKSFIVKCQIIGAIPKLSHLRAFEACSNDILWQYPPSQPNPEPRTSYHGGRKQCRWIEPFLQGLCYTMHPLKSLLHYATTQKFATMQPLKGQRYLRQCTVLRCQPLEVELKYCNFIRQAERQRRRGWSEEGEGKGGAFGETFIHKFYWASSCCFTSFFSTVAY